MKKERRSLFIFIFGKKGDRQQGENVTLNQFQLVSGWNP